MFTRHPHQPGGSWSATALLIGTTIGAGMFGLPYVMSRSGYVIGLGYLLALGIIVIILNLAYGEVILSTDGIHQLPAYVERYLGKRWKLVALLSMFIGLYGALTAYIIEAGSLLHDLLAPWLGGDVLWYRLGFFVLLSSALAFGLRVVTTVEKIVVVGVLALIVVLAIFGSPYIVFEHLITADPVNFFLPFGVVLFALAAASSIPDMHRILLKQPQLLKRSIIIGTIIPIVAYVLFVTVVVGITGPDTTQSAVIGLGRVLGQPVLVLGAVFGVLAMSTTFLALGQALREVWRYDLKQGHWAAWWCVVLPPLLIVSLNVLSFVQILGICGALIGGLDGIVIMRMHRHVQQHRQELPQYHLPQSSWLHWVVYVTFGVGIAYELFSVIVLR